MNEMTLWPGGAKYSGEPIQADALLLADFAAGLHIGTALELGCGDGIGLLLLAENYPAARIEGLEADAASAERARANLAQNALTGRVSVTEGDWRGVGAPGRYELIIANPPYFAAGSGRTPPDARRAAARQESAALSELCAAAAARLAPKGHFCLIHRAERLAELTEALRAARLEPKRIRTVHADAKHAPSLLLLEARSGAGAGLSWLPPLLIRGADGRETEEYRHITHWEDT